MKRKHRLFLQTALAESLKIVDSIKRALLLLSFSFLVLVGNAQLPSRVLVGYHENWNSLMLSQAHTNYNVICLAFALPVNAPSVGYDLRYALPPAYSSVSQMMSDIDLVHSQGKVVLLSIGGATGPIMITSAAQQTTFINSINNIFATYGNKIDGLDLDLETSSMAFGNTWTMSSPAAGQTYMVNAIKSIMATYQTTNNKKMILTMAPEVVYAMGGLSTWQVTNSNGGAFLPILDGLRNELDLLHMQLYNAGGSSGGVYAWNGTIYYDNGTADFALAMNESIVKGFTMVGGKGTFTGIPDTKVAFGLPATSSSSTAGTGYVTPAEICKAAQYFRGEISKPSSITYTMNASRPGLKGLMTWSINQDYTSVNGQWNFAINYTCGFPATLPVSMTSFEVTNNESDNAEISWATTNETNNSYFEVLRSRDGENFTVIGKVDASNNRFTVNSYSFTDSDVSYGTYYYQLKQVDFDGTYALSAVIKASLVATDNAVIVPSNASSGDVLTITNNSENDISSIQVADHTGKVYIQESNINERIDQIETKGLPLGVNIIKMVVGDKVVVKKVVIN